MQQSWRNTPTGVGKTLRGRWGRRHPGKHPHGRGEDASAPSLQPLCLETPPRAWGRHQQVVVWNSQNTTYSVLTRFQGFDDELQSGNLDGGLARRADGSNFKAGCVRNRLDEDHARFRRTVLVKVLYDGGRHRIFDARNEDIRPGLDEPQLHAPAHGGWQVICDNDEHAHSPAWQSRPRPPWPASPCRSPAV